MAGSKKRREIFSEGEDNKRGLDGKRETLPSGEPVLVPLIYERCELQRNYYPRHRPSGVLTARRRKRRKKGGKKKVEGGRFCASRQE